MLEFVERHLSAMRNCRSESDLGLVLGDLCASFGFRSGYVVENRGGSHGFVHVLDSRPDRAPWWRDHSASRRGKARPEVTEMLRRGGVQVINGEALYAPDDPMLAVARQYDMLQTVLVPVMHGSAVVGVAGFSGHPQLTDAQTMALQILIYSLFARLNDIRQNGALGQSGTLTPREREVIALSAEGMTSQQIAERLGMSPRTVNQHVDNVAVKLGTKNRAHTVAEAIRNDLLH